MTTIGLRLRPLDVLLFRDARPFSTGDTARTQWPTPATFAGLLRTHLMRHAGLSPEQLHGLHGPPREERHWFGRLRFRGPWLYVESCDEMSEWNGRDVQATNGPLLPVPADILRLKGTGEVQRLRPLPEPDLPGWRPPSSDLWPMWLSTGGASTGGGTKTESADGWLDPRGLQKYLAGHDLAATDLHPRDAFAVTEDRTGIGIDPQRRTADQERGLIYSASFWRLAPGVSFYGEIDWPDEAPDVPAINDVLPPDLVLPWGGERRCVSVQQYRDSSAGQPAAFDWRSLEPDAAGKELLTLLVTPGVFTNRSHTWMPGEQGTLRAACVPKPLPVSGWDMAGDADNGHRPRPRPTRFAVPAGAVYLWQRSRNRAEEPLNRGFRTLCEKPQDADNGWGLALGGTWKPASFD